MALVKLGPLPVFLVAPKWPTLLAPLNSPSPNIWERQNFLGALCHPSTDGDGCQCQ